MLSKRDGFFVILIAIFVMALLYTCDSSKKFERALSAQQDTAKIWRDQAGRSNAELTVTKLDFVTFKQNNSNVIDSLKKLKIKPRTVTSIVTVSTVTKDTIYLSKENPFVDKWATFNLLDSMRVVYTIRDSIALITHKKGYGFLNLKTKYVTRAISFNPKTTLNGITSVEIVPKQRRVSLGLYAGYGLQFHQVVTFGPCIGVGVSCRLF